MPSRLFRPAILGGVASILGLTFAAFSSVDYAAHLDRRLHDVHCSLVPGLTTGADEENPCRAAMYSAYSALFRGSYWGGIPISLFALGAFSFFFGFSAYLLFAGPRASQKALWFFAAAGATPFAVSIVMFIISVTKIGSLCKTCVGIYLSSSLLLVSALLVWRALKPGNDRPGRPPGKMGTARGVGARPRSVLASPRSFARVRCPTNGHSSVAASSKNGRTPAPAPSRDGALRPDPPSSSDPLCPTCRAFHQRLIAEAPDRLDVQLSLAPLDSECNWMLPGPHPGAYSLQSRDLGAIMRVRCWNGRTTSRTT
jgi:uncharacterized membrane protein